MIGRREQERHLQLEKYGLPELGNENAGPIRNNTEGNAPATNNVPEQDIGSFGRRPSLFAWRKYDGPGYFVRGGEDGIVVIVEQLCRWELGDKVDSDHVERPGRGFDGLKLSVRPMLGGPFLGTLRQADTYDLTVADMRGI